MLEKAALKTKVKCQFVIFGYHPRFPSLDSILSLATQEEVENFFCFEPENSATQACVISFSSGTTGNQKGAVLPYKCILKGRPKYLYLKENMRLLWYSNLSWNTGIFFMILCIKFRSTRVIHREFDAVKYGEIIDKYKV